VVLQSRDEHLAFCKKRAHQYVERGELLEAVTSMALDLDKHEAFRKPIYDTLALAGALFEVPRGADAVRRWIDGFN
jgi:hypothetical protein